MKIKKSPNEVRAAAKKRVAEINAGKIENWSPMDRDNSLTYEGAFEEGYDRAMKDMTE